MGSAGVGEPGRTVNPFSLSEWVRIPPPQLGKKLPKNVHFANGNRKVRERYKNGVHAMWLLTGGAR